MRMFTAFILSLYSFFLLSVFLEGGVTVYASPTYISDSCSTSIQCQVIEDEGRIVCYQDNSNLANRSVGSTIQLHTSENPSIAYYQRIHQKLDTSFYKNTTAQSYTSEIYTFPFVGITKIQV